MYYYVDVETDEIINSQYLAERRHELTGHEISIVDRATHHEVGRYM